MTSANQYANEEVLSSYGYPEGYAIKPIKEQVAILRGLFWPELGNADLKAAERPLPEGAEGYYAIPEWQALAPTYSEAVKRVLAMIASQREFCNEIRGELGDDADCEHAKTTKLLQRISEEQKDFDFNILVVPAQFGLRHRGRSVRRARECFADNEFGLGAFEVGCMLLTHPEREVQWEQLHVNCAGDEFAPHADGNFSLAPIFVFRDGKVKFNVQGSVCERYGSASGFLPTRSA